MSVYFRWFYILLNLYFEKIDEHRNAKFDMVDSLNFDWFENIGPGYAHIYKYMLTF